MHRFSAHRIAILGLTACASAISPLLAQGSVKPAEPDREAAVLGLLHRIPAAGGQLPSTPIEASTNAYGCAIVTPSMRALCGVGWKPAFDPALARSLARELCAIYGLDVEVDVPAPVGQAALIDAFDAKRGIGLELRGGVQAKALPTGGIWPTVVDEPAATDLDVNEHRLLTAANLRVHTADVQAFWLASSGDHVTTTLCYLASVVAFLNEVTDGPDVDLGALVPSRSRWLPLSAPKAHPGLTSTPWGGGQTLNTDRAMKVEFRIDSQRAHDPRDNSTSGPVANGGRPVVVQVMGLVAERGSAKVTLWQPDAAGRARVLAESDTELLFVPGTFDSTKPFSIILSLQPGQYRINDTIWMSAPAK